MIFFEGEVVRGDQRGRKLWFPTINIFVQDFLIEKWVYVFEVNGERWKLKGDDWLVGARMDKAKGGSLFGVGTVILYNEICKIDNAKWVPLDRKRENEIWERIQRDLVYGQAGTWPMSGWSWEMMARLLFEGFIFDFEGDLYGEVLEISLLWRLRDNKKFSSLDTLKEQIGKDVVMAREWLGGTEFL